ncbi:MAG TPA: recombinase family protein [Paracoccaceae bacterium]|nr:recombinase family protein [Paracoccaceae bacterium]
MGAGIERIDTGSADGELVFHVYGAIAQFGRELIAERTRDGLVAARRRGKRLGRPPVDAEKIASALKLVDGGLSNPSRQPTRPRKINGLQGTQELRAR